MINNYINFYFEKFSIDGTGSIVTFINKNEKTNFLNNFEKKLNLFTDDLAVTIYNESHHVFLEELYLIAESDLSFDTFLDKFSEKMKNDSSDYQTYDYENNNIDDGFSYNKNDLENYTSVVNKNNLDIEGNFEREKIIISPMFFNNWLEFFKNKSEKMAHFEEIKNKLYMLKELFSLFYISEEVKFKNNYFYFIINNDEGGAVELKYEWNKGKELDETNYYDVYLWIFNNLQNNSSKTSLNLVRKYFSNKDTFETENNITDKLDTILKIILKEDVEKYYLQKNKLKNELCEIEKMLLENKRNILKNLVGLITSIGLGYYGIFLKEGNPEQLFIEENKNLMILFYFMLVATIFFSITFYLNCKEVENFYLKIEEIYTKQLLFSKKDFNSVLQKPRMKDLVKYWLLLFFVIMCELLLINNYSRGRNGCIFWIIKEENRQLVLGILVLSLCTIFVSWVIIKDRKNE